jgi:hypothetical protein
MPQLTLEMVVVVVETQTQAAVGQVSVYLGTHLLFQLQ